MDKPHEIQNRINQIEAAIQQMKDSELFNDSERTENLKRYNKELEQLYLLQAKDIHVNPETEL